MATESAGLSDHRRSVTVTTLASLGGIAAGVGSAVLFGTSVEAARSTTPLLLVGAVVLAEFPLLKLLGVRIEEFGAKDNLFVGFMTVALWFICYAVLLSST